MALCFTGCRRTLARCNWSRIRTKIRYTRLPGCVTQAERVLEYLWSIAVDLTRGLLPGVAKLFDFVSPDRRVVGDAKYFSPIGGVGLPAAKFSIIAEHVWLLEKTGARTTFLVFGNDRAVPLRWLARYGVLASSVAFFFVYDDGTLERLAGPER